MAVHSNSQRNVKRLDVNGEIYFLVTGTDYVSDNESGSDIEVNYFIDRGPEKGSYLTESVTEQLPTVQPRDRVRRSHLQLLLLVVQMIGVNRLLQ